MKCTYFHSKYKELEAQEYRELAAAVKAHGGEYVFFDCDQDDADDKWREADGHDDIPVVNGCHQWMDKDDSFYVTRVSLDESGNPQIFGFRDEYGYPSDEDRLYNIQFGYLDNIITEIPETQEVHDVRELPKLNSMPVLVLSREDLEVKGYDPDMTDDEFFTLGNSVAKHLDMEDFWLSLEYACDYLGVKRLNETDDE